MKIDLHRTQFFKIALLVILLIALIVLGSKFFPFRMIDFTVYWSAGAVYLEGGNPYLPAHISAKQMETGWSQEETKLMYYFYPPWTLVLFMPFGIFDFNTGQTLWYLLNVSIVLGCAHALWLFLDGNSRRIGVGWVTSLLFAPTIFSLTFGQVSPLILLGLTGFLLFSAKGGNKFDLLAGLSASLLTLKPTLIYLFWPALLVWCISRRRWHILMGLAGAVVISQLLIIAFNPTILEDFVVSMSAVEMTNWGVPTIGSLLRRIFGAEKVWLQFIPPVGGAIWFVFFWLKEKQVWDWKEHLPLLCFGSILTTVYTWTHDQVILLPAILSIAAGLVNYLDSTKRKDVLLFGGSWLVFNIIIFAAHLSRDDSVFIWQAPLILLFYLAAKRLFWRNNAPLLAFRQT